MSDRTNVDVKACPETHESFRFCLKKDKAKKKKLNVILSSVVKELGPGNKNSGNGLLDSLLSIISAHYSENATAKKIQQKKQKKEEVDGSLFTPKDKIHSYQLGSSTSSSSESSENKFYSKIQRLLTSQTSTPSQTAGWQVPVLGVSPDVVPGSAPLCKQMDIRKSLGIDMNDSMLSWTSSMATPTLMDSTFKGSPSPMVKQQKGLPRVLFSPGPSQTDEELHTLDNTSEDNTDDDDDDLPPVSSTTKKPSVVKLVSPDITVFQNINHHEMFNADSEISEHFSAANSEIKLNAKFKSSPNFGKNALKESTSIVTSNDEEYSMPLFSQDLYVDGDAEDSQKQVYLAEISTQHDQPGNDISKTTGESLEKGVSEALSDFFDPPSSAVGRRRCAPRKGKKRKLVDSLSLEVCSDNESSINVTQSKKMKMALLSCENGENYRNMAQVQNEEDENITENKITIKNEFTEENTYSASLNSCQRKHSISQEDGSSGNCSTPINTRRTLKSILSSKKKTTEGSEVKSNKKLDDEEYVSPDIIIQTLPTDDTNSVEDFESDNDTFTRSISKQDSASHDLTSENVCIDRSPRKDFDIEFCDELFSQVSPSVLNEMCSVVTLVDKSSKTQKSNLEAGSEKAKPDLKLKADDKPVSVKTEVMEDVKTEDKEDVTLSLMKIKDENRVYTTSPLIKSEDENKVTLHVDKKEDSLQRIDPDYSRLKCLRGSLSLKTKPRKFLYPSTNQISKSCPKSVYGFSELSEKSRRSTMDTRPLVDRDTLQGTVLVQTSATKSALEERSDKSQKQEWPDLHRKSHKNIGFKSFSSLANSRKNALVTDHSDVCNDEYISQPDVLLTKAVQVGNTEEKQRKGQPENGDVQSSEWKTPLIHKVLSDSEAHVKKDSYKSQSSESEDTKIKTDISENKKQISCECVKTEMIQKQKDSSQIILNESRKHKINHVESESSSPNMLHHTVKKTTDDRNISNLENSDGNHEIREGSKSLAKCTGFSSASGKAMTFSEEGLHKAKQLFICVESDTGITDDSLEMERSLEDKNMFSVKEIHNKDKTKLPRRTFTNSDAAISCQGKTASAVSTQNSNIAGVNQQGAKGSVQDSCVDLEDMPENVLMSGSSPEVSKLSSFQKTFDHSEGFQTRRNEKLLKNSKLEIAISVMKFSELHSDLNAKNVAGNSVSSEAECNSGNHEQEDRSFHTCHTDIIHKGFTTAAGKHVQLSDTSLKKATALLDDVDTNYPPTSWSFPGSTEEVKDSLKDIRKVVKDDESIKENVHLTTAGMENRVDKDSLSCGKSSNEKSFCDSGKFKRAGMSGCKPKVSQVGRKGSDMEERKTLADSTIESSGRHLRLISDGGSKSELRSVDPVKKNATHILTDDKEVEVHLSTETCSDEEMVPEVCGRQKDDGKSAVELSTVSQKFQHFRDSSPEIPKALFIEMDKEMDTVSKYEVMNGKLGFTDKDGEKHRTIDSGVKKSDLLDADTSKGMKSGLEDINEVTKISTATAKRWKLSGSSLIKPVLFVGDMEKTVTPKDILDGDYSDTAELAGISTISGFGGFSTAGGKKLKLSCSSLKKAMSLVADVDGDVTDSSKRDIGDPTDKSDISIAGTATGSKSEIFSSAGEFGGFSTAAGRKLKLSDASLRKAMSLVVDVDSAMTDNSNQITGVRELERSTDLIANRDKLTEDRKVKEQRGFSMAGGLKGRNTTGELKEFSTADGLGGFSTADGLGGFSTADELGGFSTADGLGGFSTADGLGGFSTAGGKKLKLSDSSLRKAMSIISNVDNTDNGSFHDQYEKSGSDSCGFQTAGGKQVQISEASISKGVSVIRKVDTEEGIENSALFGNNKESVEGQNRRGELVHFEEGCTSTMLDILNPKKRSGSTIIKDKSLQTNINRKSSSRFPPGANIPKGFRPFKPPKITKKPNIAKSNDRQCVDMSNKVIDKTLTVISKSDDVPFSSSEDKCGGISGTTTFDTDAGKDISHLSKKDGVGIQKINLGAIDGCCSSVLQISQENKVEPQKDSISTVGNSRNISPEFKAQNADQDIDSSIMDELFSGELESSQHFSPGSGKVLRSQKYSTTPENQDQRPEVLPSEEYEHFLDMEDMVMCDNSTAQVKTQLPVKHTVFSVFQSASGKCVGFSEEANQQVKQPKTIGVSTETTEEHSQKEHSKQQTGDTGFQSSIKTHSVSKVVVSNEETETEDVDKNVDSEGLRCVVSKEFTASDEPWKTTHLPLSSKFTNESQNTEPKKDLIKSLNQQTVELGGFQSASGKMVHISEDALIKARQSLYNWSSEINEESLHGETQTVNEGCDGQQIFPELKGFHSASGKKISVSDDALVKARQNMREWSTDINSSTPGDRKVDSKGDKSSVTTSNKDIYEDVTFSGDNSDVKEGEWTVPEFDSFHHFTGKTKPAFKKIVREEEKDVGSCLQNDHFSLQEVMNSQYDFSQDESHYDSTRVEGGDSISSKIEMTNASGQNVSISEKALEHARKIMDDVGNSPFLSASGKKVIVSESSLEHARKSMEDVGNSPFLSASGKKMNVSESSLEHARKSMEDVGNSLFLSASGKKVNVSESSLEHARKSMEDVQNMLFQSASGKKVNISENALEHARNALEDIGNSPLLDTSPSIRSLETKYNCGNSSLHSFKKSPSSAHSSPFQTATGNKITISESSLQHVRKTKEDHELTSCIGVRNGSCDRYPISVQQTEKLNKGPKLKYQLIKEGPTVEGKQSAPTENKITPLKQKQHGGTTRPRRQGTEGSPYMGHSDRQVFIQGMEHSLEEFCQPDDFLEEMEVTPKRRRVEEKAVTRRAGIVTPMKCVPEAFTRDRQGTSCSLRPYHSTSATSQESRSDISLNNGPQTTLKSSFSTPYKKPDTNVTGTDSNPAPSSSTQTPCKQVPKFIPKCLSVHRPDLMKSQSMASPSFSQKCPSEIQTDTKEEEKSVQTDMAELLERARKHQTELLQDKKKSKISPDPGRLYSVKQGNRRLKMRDVIKLHTRYVGRSQQHYSSLWLRDVQSTTAVQYKFHLPDFYTNFQGFVYVGDGAYLVPDDKLCAGKDEFFRAFSTLVGVDCRLISDVWFYNHYRWLVWKLAAYEVTSPQNFAGRALTPEVVMLQMKYRYDREIDNCQRSALKKIMERDDTASKRMVLCVSSINQLSQPSQPDISSIQTVKGDNTVNQSVKGDNTPNQAVKGDKQALSMDKSESQTCVELTDGWYSIVAKFDVPLTDLVSKHRINVGDKLCISGAELVGSQDACTPLEAPVSLMLKLNANSTRPAPWDARLGYQMDPSPLCIPLSGLYGDGGAVGCLDVVLARKYPQMYMEKLSEGGCVFRTGQAEDRIQHKYQQHRQDEMEKLYAKLQKEFELEDVEEKCTSNKKWTKREVELLQSGHEIYEAFSTSRQPDIIEEYLSDRQRELLMERRRQIQDEKRQKLHAEFQKTWQTTSERNVIPLMKMKFVGCSRKDMDSKASTTVTVWRPTQDMMELTEGTRYKIFGLNASLSRSRYNKCDVQLTASRQTRFKPVAIDENLLDMIYEPREVLSVQDIKRRQSLYGEADFVGMVVSVSTLDFSESGRHQDVIYAVDANSDILGIKFWGGLKSFLPEDILIEGRLFCASNLMDKSAYLSSVLPLLDASMECSVITQTSQYPAQRRALERLKSVSSDTHGFLEAAKEHLSALEKQKKENTKKFTPEKNLKKSIPDPLDSILKTSAEGTSSHSLPAQSVGEDSMQPGTSKQGHITYQAKMARLLNFGSPTPLSPLLSKTSQSVNKTFKPPLLRRKSLGPNH
ncbi:breast cancer type 2 susceptibility protein homolog [Ylistrum balloti]|uniref:breast cancer type 2 susceptibility protein homolog n=1 Tax=Ylistrum balloti TaxID=509963 RepID=UPI002905E08A|nr:breast cancer type 2 susceptibility protein homolog [Ylistrum balloti]